MFAFVIYNIETKNIFGDRDRFGIKPFYYFLDQNKFIFGSEIPQFLALFDKKPEFNDQVIFDYFGFNRTDMTIELFKKEARKFTDADEAEKA